MVARTVRLVQRGRATLNGKPGLVLRLPIMLEVIAAAEWVRLVRKMYHIVLDEFELLMSTPAQDHAMDASIADQLTNRLSEKLTVLFRGAATTTATTLMARIDNASRRGMELSLKEISEQQLTLKSAALAPNVQTALQNHINDNVDLIRLIPQEFLAAVKEDVNASIVGGNGLQDLLPKLTERYGEAKRHAHNVALDQTRKAYNDLNAARMKDAGVKKFEWIHTGGSNNPRPYHKDRWPTGLNGGVFDLDNPPIIVKETGETGLPGQAIYCRCTMRPIVSFD